MTIKNNYQIFGTLKNVDIFKNPTKKEEINNKIEKIIIELEKQYGFFTTVKDNGNLYIEIKGKYSKEQIIHYIETELSKIAELELKMPYVEGKYV